MKRALVVVSLLFLTACSDSSKKETDSSKKETDPSKKETDPSKKETSPTEETSGPDRWIPAGPPVSELMNQLASPDVSVRRAAVKSLGERGPKAQGAVEVLTDLLADPALRLDAAMALGRIGSPAKRAVSELYLRFKDLANGPGILAKVLLEIDQDAADLYRRQRALEVEIKGINATIEMLEARYELAQVKGTAPAKLGELGMQVVEAKFEVVNRLEEIAAITKSLLYWGQSKADPVAVGPNKDAAVSVTPVKEAELAAEKLRLAAEDKRRADQLAADKAKQEGETNRRADQLAADQVKQEAETKRRADQLTADKTRREAELAAEKARRADQLAAEKAKQEAEAKRRADLLAAEIEALPGKLAAAQVALVVAKDKIRMIKLAENAGPYRYSGAMPADYFDAGTTKYIYYGKSQRLARTKEVQDAIDRLTADIASYEARIANKQ